MLCSGEYVGMLNESIAALCVYRKCSKTADTKLRIGSKSSETFLHLRGTCLQRALSES